MSLYCIGLAFGIAGVVGGIYWDASDGNIWFPPIGTFTLEPAP